MGGVIATLGGFVEDPRVVCHGMQIEKAQNPSWSAPINLYVYYNRFERKMGHVNQIYFSSLVNELGRNKLSRGLDKIWV